MSAPERRPEHTTPPEHRRNRKSWTEEEKRDFWHRKRAEKRERRRSHRESLGEERKAEWEGLTEEEREERRRAAAAKFEAKRAAEAEHARRCEENLGNPALPVLVFDLSFSWTMSLPDTKSTITQIYFSYSTLRRAAFPFRMAMTSLCGKSERESDVHDTVEQAKLLSALLSYEGFRRYPPVTHVQEHWSSVYPREKVVFLTADASEVLTDVEQDTMYIIGAFVDHNKYKNLTYDTAQAYGVRTARLPIEENIVLGNRTKVLTINHMTQILSAYAAEGRSWTDALEKTLPERRNRQQEVGSLHKRRRAEAADGGGEEGGVDNDLPDSSVDE